VTKEAINFFKSRGITSVECLAEDYFKEHKASLDTSVDNIIALDFKIEDKALKRTLLIIKARMGAVDIKERELILLSGKPMVRV